MKCHFEVTSKCWYKLHPIHKGSFGGGLKQWIAEKTQAQKISLSLIKAPARKTTALARTRVCPRGECTPPRQSKRDESLEKWETI